MDDGKHLELSPLRYWHSDHHNKGLRRLLTIYCYNAHSFIAHDLLNG